MCQICNGKFGAEKFWLPSREGRLLSPGTRYPKIKMGYLTPAFLGARQWAEMLPNPCILRGPEQRGQIFWAPSAPPYVWPVPIDPW